ncbi:MAG: hypothetical protein E6Q76_19625 [Rhizobium sp.]|nr:MAG: hypothetical protein E6Q76_19625 [Rhizobium sp.]
MALNQHDRIVVMLSPTMQTRCMGVVSNYALYLLGFPTNATTHDGNNARVAASAAEKAWAAGALQDLAGVARRVSVYLTNNASFVGSGSGQITGDTWAGGSDITDDALKIAAETAINNHFITA